LPFECTFPSHLTIFSEALVISFLNNTIAFVLTLTNHFWEEFTSIFDFVCNNLTFPVTFGTQFLFLLQAGKIELDAEYLADNCLSSYSEVTAQFASTTVLNFFSQHATNSS